MFLRVAALTATQVGFFTVVATAVPVFLVAYIVGLSRWVEQFGPAWDRITGNLWEGRIVPRPIFYGFVLAALLAALAAVVLPSLAEIVALNSLYVDHANTSDEAYCKLVITITLVVAVLPLLWACFRGVWRAWRAYSGRDDFPDQTGGLG